MTNHRDPIEDWLSQDVEVLPPPAGTFQRVRRKARQRKAIQAASVAAGVAVIVAAGFSVPALTGNLFQPSGPESVTTRTPNPRSTPTAGALYFPGLALASAGRGTSVPHGFRPSSVTFVADRGRFLGAVLGQAPCGGRTCTAMAGTTNYGRRWSRIGAPPAGPSSVSQVRFANSRTGWAYGPALWATHSGGRHWRRISDVAGRVVDLSTVGGHVLAVAATGCSQSRCTGFGLYAAGATSDRFVRVLPEPHGGMVTAGGLQLQAAAPAGYLIAGGRLYAGALDGGGWGYVHPGSAATPGCLDGRAAGSPAVLAPGTHVLYAACPSGGRLELYRSASSGRTWQATGAIPAAGTATSLAVSPAGTLVLATTRGLYFSPDARTWSRVTSGSSAGVAFRFVGMTSASRGVAVPASGSLGVVYVTGDGGRTWAPSKISR